MNYQKNFIWRDIVMKRKIIQGIMGVLILGFSVIGLGGSTYASKIPASISNPWWEPLKVFPTPPSGFNPVTASIQETAHYGFPQRPVNTKQLQAWTQVMEHAKQWVSPNPIPVTRLWGLVGTTGYTNWAGYYTRSADNNGVTYTSVQGMWNVESVPGNGNYQNSDWQNAPVVGFSTGIGGVSSSDLIQAGTADIATATPEYRFWTEDYPLDPIFEGPVIKPNQWAYVYIEYEGNGTTYYFLDNSTTGQWSSFINSTPDYSGTSADYVAEMPAGDPYLPDFGNAPYTDAESTTSNGDTQNFTNQNYWKAIMGHPWDIFPMAEPSSPGSGDFTVVWLNAN
jgi:hypothetical protein